jgi:hypothetical protein
MLNPETTNGAIAMRQGETIRSFWMRKKGWVKIQSQVVSPGPINPALEMFGGQFIAIDAFAGSLGIRRMQIHSMFAGNE